MRWRSLLPEVTEAEPQASHGHGSWTLDADGPLGLCPREDARATWGPPPGRSFLVFLFLGPPSCNEVTHIKTESPHDCQGQVLLQVFLLLLLF